MTLIDISHYLMLQQLQPKMFCSASPQQLPTYLPASLPTCLSACLPTYLPTYLIRSEKVSFEVVMSKLK